MRGWIKVIFYIIISISFVTSAYADSCAQLCKYFTDYMFASSLPHNPTCINNNYCEFNFVDKGVSDDAPAGKHCICYDSSTVLSCASCSNEGNIDCTKLNCSQMGWNCDSGYETTCTSFNLHCGITPPGEVCINHHVPIPCISKTCDEMGWECGYGLESNCERSLFCGECPAGEYCINHTCTTNCTPACENKECGINNCNSLCGTCSEGICVNYICVNKIRAKTYCTVYLDYDTGGCQGIDYPGTYGSSHCWGNTCYYGWKNVDTDLTSCKENGKYTLCFNVTANCGTNQNECNAKCHGWGCCEKVGTICTKDDDCCTRFCHQGVCSEKKDTVWYECITDDDCSVSNGYPPNTICVDHVCVNSLCTKNSDCLNTEFCNKSQQCQPKLNDGSNCDNITYEGTRSADDEACLSGYCDNDGKGNSDDYWCYTPEDNYLDNQDNMCEYDINSMFDFTCDEVNRTKDCSITNGRGYWCNESCMAENKDVSREACTARGINCHFDDFVWALSGEPSAAYVENQWEYKDTHTFECCGDDLNESFVNSSFYQGHNSNDTRCCLSKDACVVNGICQLGYKEGGHETSCYDGIDDNCNNKTDFCDGRYDIGCSEYDGLDDDCKAVIYGHVKDNYGFTVSNATVTALTVFHYNAFEETISFKTRTDSNGRYNLTVYGNSSYDIVATKFGYHSTSNSRHLNLADNWNLNITMQRETECNPDCTKVYSNLCYPECEGLNGCHFYNQKTMQLCNAKAKYVIMDYNSSHAVECCSGKPYVKLPSSEPKVEVDNATIVVRITKPIMYRGKLIKMVIAVANK